MGAYMYQLTNSTSIIRLFDNAAIPADPENMDYQVYLQWLADGGVPLPIAEPTPADVLITQSAKLQALTQLATAQKSALTNRIATLQDAIDNVGVEGLEEFAATPEEQIEFPQRKTQLTKWKNYAILLGRVTSQAGWPPEVEWPVQPTEGMDLTVSATAPDVV
jgi:hypothetical protein